MASNWPSIAARTICGPASPAATLESTLRPSSLARSTPRWITRLASSIGSLAVAPVLDLLGDIDQRHRDGRVEEAHDGVEEVGRERAAVVGHQQLLDAMPALAKLGEEPGDLGRGHAGLGDLAASGDIQPNVAILAEHADRQAARAWPRRR